MTTTTKTVSEIKRLGWRLAWGTALLASAPAVVGCGGAHDPADESKELTGIAGEQFTPADEPRHVNRIIDAQAAAGARRDGTLRLCHFDAGNPAALNSLGEEKLNLMLEDDDALPVVVYLDAGGDDALLSARQQSVKVYLRDRGLTEAQVTLVAGKNPGTFAPTARALRGSQALDQKALAPAAAAPGK
ncbi:MAG: hypothetical protein JWO31_392 [Phycisphaerales bacterium]|nr:hypothetical protein [Phycisphaerales bacterium]